MIYWVLGALFLVALAWVVGAFTLLARVSLANGERGKVPAIREDEVALALVWPVAIWIAFWHWIGERRKNRRLAREQREEK